MANLCGDVQTQGWEMADHLRCRFRSHKIGRYMNLHLSLTPMISLLAGILILVMPKLLNFIVAIYLIAIGVIGLIG